MTGNDRCDTCIYATDDPPGGGNGTGPAISEDPNSRSATATRPPSSPHPPPAASPSTTPARSSPPTTGAANTNRPRRWSSMNRDPGLALFDGASAKATGRALGVTGRTVVRWRNGHSRIPRLTADEIAIRHLGLHPAELWPEWGAA